MAKLLMLYRDQQGQVYAQDAPGLLLDPQLRGSSSQRTENSVPLPDLDGRKRQLTLKADIDYLRIPLLEEVLVSWLDADKQQLGTERISGPAEAGERMLQAPEGAAIALVEQHLREQADAPPYTQVQAYAPLPDSAPQSQTLYFVAEDERVTALSLRLVFPSDDISPQPD